MEEQPVGADGKASARTKRSPENNRNGNDDLKVPDWFVEEHRAELYEANDARMEEVSELIGVAYGCTLGIRMIRLDQVIEIRRTKKMSLAALSK